MHSKPDMELGHVVEQVDVQFVPWSWSSCMFPSITNCLQNGTHPYANLRNLKAT